MGGGPNAKPAPTSSTRSGETAVVVGPREYSRGYRQLPFTLVNACGPLGSHLGATPLWPSWKTGRGRIKRSADMPVNPVVEIDVFLSPILQVAWSPCVSTHRMDSGATSLLVRLAGSTHMLCLAPNPAFAFASSNASHTVSRVAELDMGMTEGRRHVDVALDPLSWGRAAIVDEGGGVWLWWEEKQRVEGELVRTTKVVKLRSPIADTKEGFFRVAFGTRPDTVLLMSRYSVEELDADPEAKSTRSSTLVSLPTSAEMMTALDRTAPLRDSAFIYVCTTKHVLWIDQSASHSPVLRWRHELGGQTDPELQLVVVASPESSEPREDAVLVYQPTSGRVHATLSSNSSPAALVSGPWTLTVPQMGVINNLLPFYPPKYERLSGIIKLVVTGDEGFSVGKLSTAGLERLGMDHDSFFSVTLLRDPSSLGSSVPSAAVSSSPVVKSASDKTAEDAQREQVLQARWAWLRINNEPSAIQQFSVTDFSRLLREDEGLVNTITTSGELARDITYQSPPNTRSHALRSLEYHSSISVADIASIPLSRYFAFSVPTGSLLGPSDCGDGLADLAMVNNNLAPSAYRQQARHALLNDISMSSQVVFSMNPETQSAPSKPDPTIDELFAEATGQLSLDDRIPTLSFSILPPPRQLLVRAVQPNDLHGTTATPAPRDLMAAHSLLLDWKLGSDPRHHDWQSPTVPPPLRSPPRRRIGLPSRPPSPHPSIIRPRSRPVSPLPRFPHSSPARARTPPASTQRLPCPSVAHAPSSPLSEQDTFPQTQIERGAHGARPEIAVKVSKKKLSKRRGGF